MIKEALQIDDLKAAYNRGYRDGQEALAFHLELCKEEQEPIFDKIITEIESHIIDSNSLDFNSALYSN